MIGHKTYSQREIIGLLDPVILEDNDVLRKYQMWFKRLLEYLKDHPKLDWKTDTTRGDFYLNCEMNLKVASPEKGRAYQYNEVTAVFLATLLHWFAEDDRFLRGSKPEVVTGNNEQIERWLEATKDFMDRFILEKIATQDISDEERHLWGIQKVNLMSQIYKLTLEEGPELTEDTLLEQLLVKTLALPYMERKDVYKKIANRLKFIEKKVDQTIQDLDSMEKLLYDVDKNAIRVIGK